MKKIFILLSLVICTTIINAQEVGKIGELLKNEASSKEIQSNKREVYTTTNTKKQRSVSASSNGRNSGRNQTQRYNWNQNYGNAEIFIRIPEYGFYTVEINDQVITNDNGKFRFFDLNPGRIPISIYEDGFLIYRTSVQIKNDHRVVLDFFNNYGLYLLDSYPISNYTYGFDQWDDIWNNPYSNNRNNQNLFYHQIMTKASFENFLYTLKKSASFDKDKFALIRQQSKSNYFSSAQIRSMLETFSFDEQRLEAGKILYDRCADIANFHIVYDTFSFDRNKRDLINYTSKKG